MSTDVESAPRPRRPALDRGRRAPGSRDLRRHRPHPDPGARRRDEPPLARRRLLAPVADLRRAARTRREEGPAAAPPPRGSLRSAVTATVVNVAVKPLARRRRPDRLAGDVPLARHVRMPSSRSFPSGHSAAAFAFATGVGHVSPAAAVPLRALAALVAYSRVHTGVHYPGDVLAGGLIGTGTGAAHHAHASPAAARRRIRRRRTAE